MVKVVALGVTLVIMSAIYTVTHNLRDSAGNAFHGLFLVVDVMESPVEWIVESGGQVVLVRSYIRRVTIIYFSYLKHTSRVTKLLPEITFHL